jgi:two-component system nitrate/nitrite response regulator NarL
MKKITLFILDDHQMLIDGLKALLKNEERFEIIGEATKAEQALVLLSQNQPDIVLTDIHMPDMSGVEFASHVRIQFPSIKVLALSMFGSEDMISAMLEAGVSGYVLKNTGQKELVAALLKIAGGEMFFSDEVSAEMMRAMSEKARKKTDEPIPVHLTDREKEILLLISKEIQKGLSV